MFYVPPAYEFSGTNADWFYAKHVDDDGLESEPVRVSGHDNRYSSGGTQRSKFRV